MNLLKCRELINMQEDDGMFGTEHTNEDPNLSGQGSKPRSKRVSVGRVMGPPCGCKRKCREQLRNGQENVIFNNFQQLGSQYHENCYLLNCIEVRNTKRTFNSRTKGPESRRLITAIYSVDNGDGDFVEICKTEFLSLHGLRNSVNRVDRIVRIKKEVLDPERHGHIKHDKSPYKRKK